MDGENERIDPDEFSRWLTPLQAIAQTNLPPQLAVEKLLTDLRFGLVRAAARVSSWHESDGEHGGEYDPIPRTFWAIQHDAGHFDGTPWGGGGHFWKTGNMAFFRQDGGSPLAAIGVRFEPNASGDPVVDQGSPEPTSKPALPPKVGRAELRKWLDGFARRNPGSSFGVILQNAKLAFPQFRVTERPTQAAIADLQLTKNPGNPAITRK